MVVLSARQMREWDAYTMQQEPISSIDLMERAAWACVNWIEKASLPFSSLYIFCGKGNNGGDGLAIARIFMERGYTVQVAILETGHPGSPDFQTNLVQLRTLEVSPLYISTMESFPEIDAAGLVIDALFGTGLNRPLTGLAADLVTAINQCNCSVISIDLPSGLLADRPDKTAVAVKATHTLSFQCYKPALLAAPFTGYFGTVHILEIGLSPEFLTTHYPLFRIMDEQTAKSMYKPRPAFAHKGNFGHASLVAGSPGMMGAVLLAGKACLKSGVGKLSLFIPWTEREIPQTALPEAMVQSASALLPEHFQEGSFPFNAIGIGPGWGATPQHRDILKNILIHFSGPMVLDADALNLLALYPELWPYVPAGTILTPHPGEAIRLFGKVEHEIDRWQQLMDIATKRNIIIIYKGHRTLIALPYPTISFFNCTGNSALAKGGSGDCLTGIITSFLAQGYPPAEAACLSVFIHGSASDILVQSGQETAETFLPGLIPDTFNLIFRSFLS